MSAGDTIVAVVRKNGREEIRVGIGEYKGYKLVSLRVWVDPYAGDERIATKAGFAFSLERIDELIAALATARRTALETGLIEVETTGGADAGT